MPYLNILRLILIFLTFFFTISPAHAQWKPLKRAKWYSSMQHIVFSDKNNGVMTSYFDVYQTWDGGQNWTQPFVQDTLWHFLSGSFRNTPVIMDDQIWLLDDEGVFVQLYQDGTYKFLNCKFLLTDEYDGLTTFDFVGDSLIWVGARSGKLHLSRNLGSNWDEIFQFDKRINDFTFLNENTGIALVGGGRNAGNVLVPTTVYSTHNGGDSWQESTSLNPAGVKIKIVSYGEQHAWVLGTWYTHDGGRTWHKAAGIPDSVAQLSLFFLDENNGWSCGRDGAVMRSRDGGATWREVTRPTANDLNEIYFIDENHGWVVGKWGFVAETKDGGDSWQWLMEMPGNTLSQIHFTDENNGYAIGTDIFIQTKDGGENWEFIPDISGSDVEFADKNNGWLITYDEILGTQNAGNTWQKQAEYKSKNIVDLKVLDKNTAWFMAHIADSATVFRTTNAGTDWVKMADIPWNLNAVEFVSPNIGWGVGDKGIILKTEDGGQSWSKQYQGRQDIFGAFNSVDFVDESYGWAVNWSAEVFLTTNGGAQWQQIFPNHRFYTELMSVQFFNRKEGWAAGTYGVILHTIDGGLTWDDSHSQEQGNWWADIFFLNENLGWTCGLYGAIDKYERTPDGVLMGASNEFLQPKLFPAQPNPVRNQTRIVYSLPAEMTVTLNIVDLRGRRIRQLFQGRQFAGEHQINWNGCNQHGKKVSSGVYLLHLMTKNNVLVQKMTVLH